MALKLGQRLKDILLPRFSEIELISFFFIIFLLAFENREQVIGVTVRDLTDIFTNPPPDVLILLVFIFGGLIFGFIYFIIKLIENAVRSKPMSTTDKKLFATIFYCILGVITISATMELIPIYKGGIIQAIEILGLLVIAIKSFMTIFAVAILQDMEHIYIARFTDEQITKLELVLLLGCAILVFWALRPTHSAVTTISLSYFYVTTFILFYRRIKNLVTIIKN